MNDVLKVDEQTRADDAAAAQGRASRMNSTKSNKLTDAQKTFVVQRLAAFEGPKAVVEAVRAQFGVEMAVTSVAYYDPTTYAGRAVAPEWRNLFLSTRERILAAARREIDGAALCPRCQAMNRVSSGEPRQAAAGDGSQSFTDEERLKAIFALLQKVKARVTCAPDALDPLRLFDAATREAGPAAAPGTAEHGSECA